MTLETPPIPTRTAAIRQAKREVSLSQFGDRQYIVSVFDEKADAWRDSPPMDIWKARAQRTAQTAERALELLGIEMGCYDLPGRVEEIVRREMAKEGR